MKAAMASEDMKMAVRGNITMHIGEIMVAEVRFDL